MKAEDVIEQVRDYSPRTDTDSLERFMEGSIHSDFLGEIAIRVESMRDFLEAADSKSFLKTQGGIQALRLVSGIFQDLYENSKSDNRQIKHEGE